MRAIRRIGGISGISLGVVVLACASTLAADHSIGIRASHFSPGDSPTESTFGVDDGPIPGVFYAFREDRHGVVATIGRESWTRQSGGNVAELEFVPLTAAYRYHFTPSRAVSAFVGGGVGLMIFDATVDGPSALLAETGYSTALEPGGGVVFFPTKRFRVELEAKYSWQVFSSEDFDLGFQTIDVDMSGLHVTLGVAVKVGR